MLAALGIAASSAFTPTPTSPSKASTEFDQARTSTCVQHVLRNAKEAANLAASFTFFAAPSVSGLKYLKVFPSISKYLGAPARG
jgi:hypothetical protein